MLSVRGWTGLTGRAVGERGCQAVKGYFKVPEPPVDNRILLQLEALVGVILLLKGLEGFPCQLPEAELHLTIASRTSVIIVITE